MADTKISALSAAASVAGANEFAINEAGTSKKATATQIKTFVLVSPVVVTGDVNATNAALAGVFNTTGVAQLVTGGAGGSGYLAIHKPDGTRMGYIGDSQTNLKIVAEVGVVEIIGKITASVAPANNPATQAFADAASKGAGTGVAWDDHKHAMPTLGFGLTNNSTPAVSLTTAQAFATATTSISAATYADVTGASISLAAGTWLVMGQASGSSVNAQAMMHVAITDGANAVVSEGSQGIIASGTASVAQVGNVAVRAIVSPGSTTTYKLRAARGLTTITGTWVCMDGAGTNTTNNLTDNSDKGTGIFAIRVA